MTIKYLDSKRISLDTSATFSEDFSSSDGWTLDSRQSISGGALFSPDSNNPNAYITHGFKSFAIGSPDKMVFNWDWKFVGSPFKLPFIQLASDVTVGRWNDPVGNAGGYGNALEGEKKIIIKINGDLMGVSYRYFPTGGSHADSSVDSNSATPVAGTTYYYQFIKDGNDISLKRYGSDADRVSQTSPQQTVTDTWTSASWTGTSDLAFIDEGSYGNYGSNTGSNYLYDFKLYSGVTSAPAKPTNVQDNSILVEKDTGRRYWFDAEISNLALTDPTPASSDYTNSGSSFTFASNKIHVDAVGYGSTLTMCTRPLTTTFIPTTNGCMIDFKFNWTTAGGSGNDTGVAIGLFDTRAQADGTNNGINIEFVTSPSYARNVQFRCEGIFDNSSTQGYPVPDEYYCRIIVQKDGSATGKGYTSEADRTADTNAVFSRSTAAQTGFSEKTIFGILNKRPTGGGNVVGDLDSINVYSGITATTPATWTMNPTYESDFTTSTGWTADTADITYDATNYEIDWSADGTASSQVKSYDLTSVSDTKWVLRTKVNIKNFSANTNADWNQFSIGLGSASTNMNTAKDYGGFIVSNLTGGDAGYQALMTTSDQNRFGTIFSRSMSAETLYVEMIRESDTVFRVNLYSDSDYSSLLETQTDTVSAGTVTDLRYLLISTNRQSSEGGTNNGSVDDIKFYNGVTSV